MKKVIALKDYSDNYNILQEGMIYNLSDTTANKLIEKEACAVITGSPDDVSVSQTVTSGTEIANVTINGQSTKLYAPIAETPEESNILIVSISSTGNEYTADKTYSEIVSAIEAGKFVVAFDSGKEYHLENNFATEVTFANLSYYAYDNDEFLHTQIFSITNQDEVEYANFNIQLNQTTPGL